MAHQETAAEQVKFVSDNWAGVAPEVSEYMDHINGLAPMPSYGNDPITTQADEQFREVFDDQARVLYVTSGTAANALGLSLLAGRGEGVVCSQAAHMYAEESGAVPAITGAQLFPLPHENGKIDMEALSEEVARRKSVGFHAAQLKVVSITNPTEYGVCYTPDEVADIADFCHSNGLRLHMDGCRLPNAAVAQNTSLADYTAEAGVDVLSFGGAKNGLANAEAVVVFDGVPEGELRQFQKRSAVLTSKLWTVSGQFVPYLGEELWNRNAAQANRSAQELAAGLRAQPEGRARVVRPVETNQVFAVIADELKVALDGTFLSWSGSEARFVAAWSHTSEQVRSFLGRLALPEPA